MAASATLHDLAQRARSLDGKGYGAYKQLAGEYSDGALRLVIDHVEADPYAAPSKVRVIAPREAFAIDATLTASPLDRTAAADVLARRFAAEAKGNRDISIGVLGQEVLPRTNVEVIEDRVEFRLLVSLPAKGRRILGRRAAEVLEDAVELASRALAVDETSVRDAVELLRDQEALRAELPDRGLVAFIGDGANLPRRSGDSDLPLEGGVAFQSPEHLRATFDLPSGRRVTGMGVPAGVTVIVGGGYHGKSTLLRALERGVYPHISGDGREWAITRADAVSVRAEDGRPVTAQDISAFITNLPTGADTAAFSTTNASGSTSQAANVVEAVQSGASTLLIDEDTSATNFIIRDELMGRLIEADREPITPLTARVRSLYAELGVSTVMVAGGSGAFLGLADTVIAMDAYVPADVTERAHAIAAEAGAAPPQRALEDTSFACDTRTLNPSCLSVEVRGRRKAPKPRGADTISIGRSDIDLSALSQVAGAAQVAAIAEALEELARERREVSLAGAVDKLCALVHVEGPAALSRRDHPGHLTAPRRFEVLAALNRFRDLDAR